MDSEDLAPIILFVYNRLLHTEKTVNELLKNEFASESNLIVFSDGYKDDVDKVSVEKVRNYIKTIKGFNSLRIIERERNYGLGNNIIDGVSSIIKEFGKVIVLEDDLLTSPFFLRYMNEGLQKYKDVENVISIHSYIYPIKKKLPETFLIKGADCLGWATWESKWKLFEVDGSKLLSVIEAENSAKDFEFNHSYPYVKMLKDQISGINSSWAIRWYASAFIHDMLTLYPGRSLVYHNGSDGSGTNVGFTTFFDVELSNTPIQIGKIQIEENKIVRRYFELFFRHNNASLLRILYRMAKHFILSTYS